MKSWELRTRRRVFETPWFALREDRRVSPRNGEEAPFYVLECNDWVNVVAVTDDHDLVLVRQFRFGSETFSLEVPGGVIETGEAPVAAAVRELREETGYEGTRVRELGWVQPNPALQANRCYTFAVEGCRRVGEPQLDLYEDMEVELLPLADLPGAVAHGHVRHALALAALYQYRLLQLTGASTST